MKKTNQQKYNEAVTKILDDPNLKVHEKLIAALQVPFKKDEKIGE